MSTERSHKMLEIESNVDTLQYAFQAVRTDSSTAVGIDLVDHFGFTTAMTLAYA